ncbi:MAG: hypothetical protein ACREHG_00575 [Candidatus Saccharimonadales bacterium]
MDLNIQFANQQQRNFYYARNRNQCFSGAFNNGKTFAGCLKLQTLLFTFPNYRTAIARQVFTDLRKTTMQTFFKQCPSELIESHNEQAGYTQFKNGSGVFWLHLDKVDENTLRGLEINSYLVDQAEEMEEKVFDVLDARLGRWDGAMVPHNLLTDDWPMNALINKPIVPSYGMLLCNPADFFHFIYRKFHPDSEERDPSYFFIEGEWDPTLGSYETYEQMLKKDPEWVSKYVRGAWGRSEASIHTIFPQSRLEYTPELLELIRSKGKISRVLDHGDAAPTCCSWWAAINGVYIAFKEYYQPNTVISKHRQAIFDLSEGLYINSNYADPSIFKKSAQKEGNFWSVADEYRTSSINGPAIVWIPADNNEFATRNRINELLIPSKRFKHPITGESPAPGMYFLEACREYPFGCKELIRQTGAQRKKLIGTIEGKSIWSDERDDNITDHAYDNVRYYVASHGTQPEKHRRKPPKNSFAYYNAVLSRVHAPRAASSL